MLDQPKKLRITFESYGCKYVYESPQNDFTADELIDIFKHILVAEGFPACILDSPES